VDPTQPTTHQKLKISTQHEPTQPNPWVNPTLGQLWGIHSSGGRMSCIGQCAAWRRRRRDDYSARRAVGRPGDGRTDLPGAIDRQTAKTQLVRPALRLARSLGIVVPSTAGRPHRFNGVSRFDEIIRRSCIGGGSWPRFGRTRTDQLSERGAFFQRCYLSPLSFRTMDCSQFT